MRCATAAFLVSSFKTGLFNFNVKQKNRKKQEIFMCDNNFVILFTPGCFQSIQNHFHHLPLDMVSAKSKQNGHFPMNLNYNKFALLWSEAQLCLPYVCL